MTEDGHYCDAIDGRLSFPEEKCGYCSAEEVPQSDV